MKTTLLFFCFFTWYSLSAQRHIDFHIQLPEPLVANAGNEIDVFPDSWAVIGGSPSATGGQEPFSFLWTPGTYLNDSSLSNPTATPEESITYVLLVTDYNNCTAIDSIHINVITTSIANDLKSEKTPLVQYLAESKIIRVYFNNELPDNSNYFLAVRDLSGRTLKTLSLSEAYNSFVDIGIEGFPHILLLNIYNESENFPFIIKNL